DVAREGGFLPGEEILGAELAFAERRAERLCVLAHRYPAVLTTSATGTVTSISRTIARKAALRARSSAKLPSSTIRPASMKKRRSQLRTVLRRCAMMMTVCISLRRWIASETVASVVASSEEVDSS